MGCAAINSWRRLFKPFKCSLQLRRSGFTLLEVLLSLMLAVLVLMVVATAVDLNLRMLRSSRTDVEQCQLARVILRQVGSDLRNTVPYVAPPSAGTTTAIAAFSGDSAQIRFDMSHAIKRSSSSAAPSDTDLVTGPAGDVRTMAYILALGNLDGSSDGSGGLVRYETDRATAVLADSDGRFTTELNSQTPIAAEVTALQFSYWDGSQWVDEWDSNEKQGLPLAVDVAITVVRSQADGSSPTPSASLDGSADDSSRTYRLRVNIPTAVAISSTGS